MKPSEPIEIAHGRMLDAWAAHLGVPSRGLGEPDYTFRWRIGLANEHAFLRALYESKTLAGALAACQAHGVDPATVRVDLNDAVWRMR
jgi:hypothetical protein